MIQHGISATVAGARTIVGKVGDTEAEGGARRTLEGVETKKDDG